MTILFCTNTFDSTINGPSKFAKYLLELNNRPEIELHILTEDINSSTTYLHKVEVRKTLLTSFFGMLTRNVDYYKAISAFIDNYFTPDIIVFNNAIVGVKTFRNNIIPCIGMINDNLSINKESLNFGIKKYIRHQVFHQYESKACKYADAIIVNSKALHKLVNIEYYLNNDKIKLLYKGIDTKIDIATKEFYANGILKVLFVKSDFIRGGLETLMAALKLLDKEVILKVIGPAPKDILNLVNKYQNEYFKIEGTGNCKQSEVYNYMRKSDIFCTPSITEALGIANMEALLHKLPVVYTNVGGIPEVMDYGNNGFEAEAGDTKSLLSAIVRCIENPNERKEKINAGYAYVKYKYDKELMLNNFVRICSDVVNA